jgi:hypothetical protein
LNAWLKRLSEEAGIFPVHDERHLTTHCFRRGGAQFRFFSAREKWPLEVCKRWGGWAPTEGHQTLINYILNEYEARESEISDM